MPHDQAYLEAEKKIEEALKSGAKILDLRPELDDEFEENGSVLTELPESLRQLSNLQVLIVRENKLTKLPTWIGDLKQLSWLDLAFNNIRSLPNSLKRLTQLNLLDLSNNRLTSLPEWIGELTELQSLSLYKNKLTTLPQSLGNLLQLQMLDLSSNQLPTIPDNISRLKRLQMLLLSNNQFRDIPSPLADLVISGTYIIEYDNFDARDYRRTDFLPLDEEEDWAESESEDNESDLLKSESYKDYYSIPMGQLRLWGTLCINDNPLNPELAEAYKQGTKGVIAYLRAKAEGQIVLNEAKLILVGEGEVGKTCLLGALRGDPFVEGLPTTHGIEIKPVNVKVPKSKTEITLNGWDFGGQRVYRPTHQLFFSAPAVYLVVWKPREGPQQGFVKEWIKLVKHREPDAKILVVATHGGPQQRQPDIDRQELWDLFGRETVADFFFVDSKPDAHGNRKGIDELKLAIARLAAELPEVGRSVPKSFQDVREALGARSVPYLPLDEVLAICRARNMDDEIARLYLTISHRLGHLTHYQHDPALRDIVILRPDWLATAISYILDDETTRNNHGLVRFSRLAQLWDDKTRAADSRYPKTLHPIFLRLMERFDLSYRVADSTPRGESDPQSLIAQLVPDNRPENFAAAWVSSPSIGDLQQTQICRIVDDKGNTATAEGLFYQLIVRLHKYSLGRVDYKDSVHWQRGLVLDNSYNGRAFLEHKGNDIHITVQAAYPQGFLTILTDEVKFLVESFWEGLRCEVTVPCLNPNPCAGLFEVSKLIDNKKQGRPEQPCFVCNYWQSIDSLLANAPAATQPISLDVLIKQFVEVKNQLSEVNENTRRILSQVDKNYVDFIKVFTDEAKEGPRLFSFFPMERSKFNPKEWTRHQFRLVLWCEHSRLPLPALNGIDSKKGVYDLELTREWFTKAAPYLKLLTGTLSLVLPVASSTLKVIDDAAFKTLENQLGLGKEALDAFTGAGTAINEFIGAVDTTGLKQGVSVRGDGAILREFHSLLKAKDPSNNFGGLVRVMNKRQEFLWVHERYTSEY